MRTCYEELHRITVYPLRSKYYFQYFVLTLSINDLPSGKKPKFPRSFQIWIHRAAELQLNKVDLMKSNGNLLKITRTYYCRLVHILLNNHLWEISRFVIFIIYFKINYLIWVVNNFLYREWYNIRKIHAVLKKTGEGHEFKTFALQISGHYNYHPQSLFICLIWFLKQNSNMFPNGN
jgi:hypothetical protein